MQQRIFLYVIGFIIALSSCVKQVDYKLPPQEVFPIVYSFLSPDSIVSCMLWKSDGVLRNYGRSYEPITDAQVLIYENGIFFDTLKHQDGSYYKGHSSPKMGALYSLHIQSKGIELTSETSIPFPVILDSVVVRQDETYFHPSSQFYLPMHKIYLNDTSLNSNLVEFFYFDYYYPNDLDSSKIAVSAGTGVGWYLTEIDYKIKDEIALENQPSSFVFSDKYFNGQKTEIKVAMNLWNNYAALRTLSNEYYQFKQNYYAHLQSIELNDDQGAGLVKQILFGGEPVKMYSNIKGGGFGVFAGYCQDTVKTIIYQ